MKKIYFEPEMDIVEVKMLNLICISPGIDENGEVIPGEGDPSDENWGSDY